MHSVETVLQMLIFPQESSKWSMILSCDARHLRKPQVPASPVPIRVNDWYSTGYPLCKMIAPTCGLSDLNMFGVG